MCADMSPIVQTSYTDVQYGRTRRTYYTGGMTQRDALLTGAKHCLTQKGYGRTTARDIAAASGANLGSIGYHFGSKDRLMNAAALELTGEWGDTIEAAARLTPSGSPLERLTGLVVELARRVPESWNLQSAGLQSLAQAEFDEDLRAQIATALTGARCELAAIVLDREHVEPGSAEERGVGFVVYSMVVGLVAQAVVDPATIVEPEVIGRAFAILA